MHPIRTIIGYTSNLRRYFIAIALTSVLGAGISLLTPVLIKFATDWVVAIAAGSDEFSWSFLGWLFGGFVLLSVLGIVATDIGGWFGDVMSIKVRRQLSPNTPAPANAATEILR